MTPPPEPLPTTCPTCGSPLEVTVDTPHDCALEDAKDSADTRLKVKAEKIQETTERIAKHLIESPPLP